MPQLSVLTLNLARPTADRARPLLEYLWHRPEDLLVLTEVGRGAGSNLVASVCRQAGSTVLDSRAGDYGVLLVARTGTLAADPEFPRPDLMPDRVAAATWNDVIDIVGIYGAASDPVRYSSQKQRQRKRDWLASFDTALDRVDLDRRRVPHRQRRGRGELGRSQRRRLPLRPRVRHHESGCCSIGLRLGPHSTRTVADRSFRAVDHSGTRPVVAAYRRSCRP